jgi:hypothetical protein
MAWVQTDTIHPGQYIMGDVLSGVNFDVFSTITPDELLAAVRAQAKGWDPTNVQWARGVFGVGETLRVFGRASTSVPSLSASADIAAGVNSFLFMGGASVQVYASDSLIIPKLSDPSQDWQTTLKWAAAAVIVVAAAWGIYQIRKTLA